MNAEHMLYEWRNVPRSDGYSPAELMFGRAQRMSLPTLLSQNVPIDFKSAPHQRMLHTREQSLTMTGRSFLYHLYLRARMFIYKFLSLWHGTDGELSSLFDLTGYLTSSVPTTGSLRAHVAY